MFPAILAAINLAKSKADSQNQFAQNLNTNSLAQQQPQQIQQQPQQQQNKTNLFSIFQKIYGGLNQ